MSDRQVAKIQHWYRRSNERAARPLHTIYLAILH
jgi:hypothetical protein